MSGVRVTLSSGERTEVALQETDVEGEYRGDVTYGTYTVETSLTGFHKDSRSISVNSEPLWVALAPSFIDFSEPNYSRTAVSGHVTFKPRRSRSYWIRFVSLYGTEMVEGPVDDKGNYRVSIDGDGAYAIWVVGNEGFECDYRVINFGRRGPSTQDLECR